MNNDNNNNNNNNINRSSDVNFDDVDQKNVPLEEEEEKEEESKGNVKEESDKKEIVLEDTKIGIANKKEEVNAATKPGAVAVAAAAPENTTAEDSGRKAEKGKSCANSENATSEAADVPEIAPLDAATDGQQEQPLMIADSTAEPPFNPSGAQAEEAVVVITDVNEPPFQHTTTEAATTANTSTTGEDEKEQEPNEEARTELRASNPQQQQDLTLPIISARLVEEETPDDGFHGIIQAPVSGTFQNNIIVEAKPLEEGRDEGFCRLLLKSRTGFVCAVLLVLLVAGLGIGLFGVTLGTSSSSSGTRGAPSPTTSPTRVPLSMMELRDIIVSAFPAAAASIDEEEQNVTSSSSPRQRALQWISQDPSLSTYDEDRIIQRWIFGTMYYSMWGDSWKKNRGWLGTAENGRGNECLWEGLSCNDTDDLSIGITSINIQENGINGTLPPEIAWLNESLRFIQLKDNDISGTIPTEFGQLSLIKKITLRLNSLSGPIPTELAQLKNLTKLHLDQNQLTGVIPSELGELKKLDLLNVRSNRLCGDMPQEICDLRSVNLTTLQADCEGKSKVNCNCCTKCWSEKNSFCGPGDI